MANAMMPRLWLALKPFVARQTVVWRVMTGIARSIAARTEGSLGSSLLP
jgi:hypothetical protein